MPIDYARVSKVERDTELKMRALENAGVRLARQMAIGKYTKTELASMRGVSSSTVKRTLWRLGLDTISQKHAHGMLVNGGQAAWAR